MEKKYIITLKDAIYDGELWDDKLFCDKVFTDSGTQRGIIEYKIGDTTFFIPLHNVLGYRINVNFKP